MVTTIEPSHKNLTLLYKREKVISIFTEWQGKNYVETGSKIVDYAEAKTNKKTIVGLYHPVRWRVGVDLRI